MWARKTRGLFKQLIVRLWVFTFDALLNCLIKEELHERTAQSLRKDKRVLA
jgi:hypothetical protein